MKWINKLFLFAFLIIPRTRGDSHLCWRISKLSVFLQRPKELSLCHKFRFSDPYIFAIRCFRPFISQTVNYVGPNNLSLKYKRFTPSGYKDIEIRKFEFVTKTQFLWWITKKYLNYGGQIKLKFKFKRSGSTSDKLRSISSAPFPELNACHKL